MSKTTQNDQNQGLTDRSSDRSTAATLYVSIRSSKQSAAHVHQDHDAIVGTAASGIAPHRMNAGDDDPGTTTILTQPRKRKTTTRTSGGVVSNPSPTHPHYHNNSRNAYDA